MSRTSLTGAVLLSILLASGARAATWNWDQNADRIDDHIQAVETTGLAAAFEDGELDGRAIIQLDVVNGTPLYGVYVRYDRRPTESDEAALAALGFDRTKRYLYIDYIRARGSYTQILQALQLPGVDRVEGQHLMYPVNDNGTKTMGAAASDFARFPTATGELGLTGRGVVIAILDSGVNDAPDALTGYPGHESLIGKFVGGGNFSNPDPMLNTPLTGSENPVDRSEGTPHGSHVAGSAMGSGGPTGMIPGGPYGFYRGVAPDVRLVDCKVLTDAGVGGGSPDAIEWCIYHKDWDWGLAGADSVYRGIQVINASIGGLSESDGTDANSAAFNAAVRAGIVACVSSGNDGELGYISSPGAADLVLTIGAANDANTLSGGDDEVTDFSNEGPRDADGDSDRVDEMKPALCPTGAGVTSVLGALTTTGDQYVTINGTSMSSPMAAGLCALVVQACPGITPAEVKRIVQDTADHRKDGGKQAPGASPDLQAIDPNYHPSWGWGYPNAYAAGLEALYPNRTQVVREWAEVVVGGIDVRWTTQREVNCAGFDVLRADPIYGDRGPFRVVTASLVPAVGDPIIHRDDNRHDYVYEDRDSTLVPGETYWYRVRWRDALGIPHDEPAFPVVYDPPVPVATISWSITHNTLDNDLLVYLGCGDDASEPFRTARYFLPAPGSGAADSIVTVPGTAELGTQRHFWHLTLTDRDFGAAQFLPPSAQNPWFLWVNEAGFVNRAGRVESFSITFHGPGGDQTFTAANPPTPTVETQTTIFWIPLDPVTTLDHPPVLDPVGDREAVEGRTLAFTISGSDPDGDAITWSATELPPGATFTPATRTFSWSPTYAAVNATTTFHATFRASNLGGFDEERIAVRLHDVDPNGNLPPWWEPANDRSVIRGETISFQVAAVDAEGDPLTYTAAGLPLNAVFDANSRTFTWTPGQNTQGAYPITFRVNDGVHPDVADEVVITVKTPLPPLLGSCTNQHFVYSGQVGIGSSDLGTADYDTVHFTLGVPAVRLVASVEWTGGPDIDVVLYDANGNSVQGAASLANPETMLVDNLPAGDYYFVIEGFTVAVPADWTLEMDQCLSVGTAGVDPAPLPPAFRLSQNFPNPVTHQGTRIRFATGERTHVRLTIFDVQGRRVRALLDEEMPAGEHELAWDGADERGRAVAAGVYFYRMEVPEKFVETRRLLRLK
jgi:hypothetical protein